MHTGERAVDVLFPKVFNVYKSEIYFHFRLLRCSEHCKLVRLFLHRCTFLSLRIFKLKLTNCQRHQKLSVSFFIVTFITVVFFLFIAILLSLRRSGLQVGTNKTMQRYAYVDLNKKSFRKYINKNAAAEHRDKHWIKIIKRKKQCTINVQIDAAVCLFNAITCYSLNLFKSLFSTLGHDCWLPEIIFDKFSSDLLKLVIKIKIFHDLSMSFQMSWLTSCSNVTRSDYLRKPVSSTLLTCFKPC